MRKFLSLLTVPLLAAGFLVAKPGEAKAEFKVCNQSGQDTHVAFGYPENGNWYVRGWFVIANGTCQTVENAPLRSSYYYLHAEDYDGNKWGGDANICTPWVQHRNSFTMQVSREKNATCSPPNKSLMTYRRINTGNARNFTYTLQY